MARTPRDQYLSIITEDRDAFDGAETVYANRFIELKNAESLLPDMARPWARRPLGINDIRGMCLHHSAVWSSFSQQNRTARRTRAGAQERLAYTIGCHHRPHLAHGSRVQLYMFNNFEALSWHSGSKSKAHSLHWRHLRKTQNVRDPNRYLVGLCLRGLLSTFGHAVNWPEREKKSLATARAGQQNMLILRPSLDQLRAIWGVHQMCLELFPNYQGHLTGDRSWFLGHFDTGKQACPGTDLTQLVLDMRRGAFSTWEQLQTWGIDRGLVHGDYPTDYEAYAGEPYPEGPRAAGDPPAARPHDFIAPAPSNVGVEAPTAAEAEGGGHVQGPFPRAQEFQWLLVALGYDLGEGGPLRDGVDGVWGPKSTKALAAFEDAQGLLTNGLMDWISYRALEAHYHADWLSAPRWDMSARAARAARVR